MVVLIVCRFSVRVHILSEFVYGHRCANLKDPKVRELTMESGGYSRQNKHALQMNEGEGPRLWGQREPQS